MVVSNPSSLSQDDWLPILECYHHRLHYSPTQLMMRSLHRFHQAGFFSNRHGPNSAPTPPPSMTPSTLPLNASCPPHHHPQTLHRMPPSLTKKRQQDRHLCHFDQIATTLKIPHLHAVAAPRFTRLLLGLLRQALSFSIGRIAQPSAISTSLFGCRRRHCFHCPLGRCFPLGGLMRLFSCH